MSIVPLPEKQIEAKQIARAYRRFAADCKETLLTQISTLFFKTNNLIDQRVALAEAQRMLDLIESAFIKAHSIDEREKANDDL